MKLVVPKFWYQKNSLWFHILYPVSLIYRGLLLIRSYLYRCGIFKKYRSPVPVVIIGNITVGGTGKTPLVIELAKSLRMVGWNPGIVSRGYGGSCTDFPCVVTPSSDPAVVGDEPILLARGSECPVAIAPKRELAVRELIRYHNCDVIICDDGLQHYALARDIEIAVLDRARMLGNGHCLPAGPLREPVGRLHTVNFIVMNGGSDNDAYYSMDIIPGELCNLRSSACKTMQEYAGEKVHAVAGIGNPQRFFDQLRTFRVEVIEHAFPDHHAYQISDFDFQDELPVIMTEKDAVKCAKFARENFWYLPITAKLEERMLVAVKELLNKKRPK